MKVRITNAKAPWPAGAGVGAIVSFEGDVAPAWAVGKFALAQEGAKAGFAYDPADVLVVELTTTESLDIKLLNAEIADLQAKLATAGKDLAEAHDKAKAETARADDLQAKLAAAESALATAKAGKK